VFQVQKRDDGRVLAMKVMRKAHVVEKNQAEYMRTERDVLTRVEHPYIVTLQYSFQTATKLYLILDFINGGHLFFQLYRAGIFEEALARVYTAEIVLALAHLHSLGIAHRGARRGERAHPACARLTLHLLSARLQT
jgi:p70 ribosomal S6 kinase